MLVAGTDTSYTLLEWAMAELINHPTEMRKLQDEIRAAVGSSSGGVTEDDLPRLPYLKAVIKETLRLHPPGPLLLPRETLEDTELQGYHVPARTRVVINVWAIGRDPATWGENAEEFVPERFAADGEAEEYQKMGLDFRFLPFGAGRRGCPGVGFAAPANELALASLLYHFDWEVPGGGTASAAVDTSEVNGLAVRLKKALLLVAKPWPR
jgi:cytochrome P450